MLDNNLTLGEIAKLVTGDNNIKEIENNVIPVYECDCSKEHMKEALISIGREELEDILKTDKKAEIVCHFCNKKYIFTEQELKEILLTM